MAIGSDPIEGGEAGSAPVDPAELVHDARKAIKRMRALARLLRHELGEPEFRRVNDSLRSAAQRLAGARDAEVRLATLDALAKRHPRALAPERVRPLRERAWRASAAPRSRPQSANECSPTSPRCVAAWRAGSCSSTTSTRSPPDCDASIAKDAGAVGGQSVGMRAALRTCTTGASA